MASVASQLIEEVTAHVQSDNLEDVREICADGTYFPNNLRMFISCILNNKCLLYTNIWTNNKEQKVIGPNPLYELAQDVALLN